MLPSRIAAEVVSTCLMVLGAGVVSSQDYPNRPVRIVTGSVGGGGDFTSRQIAQGISPALGQQVIVENRGNFTGEGVAKAPADGHTLLVDGNSLWIGSLLQELPYDAVRDFLPITVAVNIPNVLVVHPSLRVKSVKELIALAKARPGELNYASTVTGSSQHLAAELFKAMAGVNIVRIPYKGSAPALTDLLSGEVQMMINDAGSVAQHVKSGRLRVLAVTSAEPSTLTPGLPTVAASGLPGYESIGMTVMFAPGKTPAAIINRLNQETVRVLNRAEVKERFLVAGSEIVASSPEQFAATLKSDISKWSKVIRDAGIKVEPKNGS